MTGRLAISVLTLLLLACSSATASDLATDLQQRRARLMEKLGADSVFVIWSGTEKNYSNDVDYEFRQESNFYYLTGIEQSGSVLVLMPGNQERKEILFVRKRDAVREHWNGKILSPEEATAQSGVRTVHLNTEFDAFIDSILDRKSYGTGVAPQEFEAFFSALSNGKGKLQLMLPQSTPNAPPPSGPAVDLARRTRDKFTGFAVQDSTKLVHALRQVKTPFEMKILERSAEISSEAHLAGMRAARPGAFEYEVEAAIEYVYKKSGALDWAYPSIVGSGPNATILHYSRSNRKMVDGDLLLVDASGNYQYYTVDITRTYPINGKFTQAQKDIYSIVLAAQEEAMKAVKTGVKVSDVHARTVDIVKQGLYRLGLITNTSNDQFRTWYTHGSVHWIGIDVHDVGERDRPLETGMSFVIEPGIYIREGALEQLPDTPEMKEFAEKVRPAYEKYKNIGIRVEDSFLMTDSGPKRLSAKVPRTVEEIEAFMRTRSAQFGLR